jgi:hypothetical protein
MLTRFKGRAGGLLLKPYERMHVTNNGVRHLNVRIVASEQTYADALHTS